jgi:hypothetical protein
VVSVTFHPTASGTRTGTLTLSSNAGNGPTVVSLTGTGSGGSGGGGTTNLAAGRPASASSTNASYVSGNVTDADASTYWESANNAFPQWVQVDLGSALQVGRATLKLPASWGARTQTLSILGSSDGVTFSTLVGSAAYTFDPASANTVNVTLPGSSVRYLRVSVTANTGWPAAQLSDLEVFGATAGGSATLTATPASLTFPGTATGATSAAQSVSVQNTGTASASVSSIAATGDFAQTNTCGSSIAAGGSCSVSVMFKPAATGTRSGTLTIASNATNPTLTVPLSGTGTTPTATNLAAGRPATASTYTQTYVPGNVTDADPSSYWESANNAFPQWIQVDLGSAQQVGRVVLRLPPATSWAARQQTLALTGSTDGTTFTTLKASASYGFDPSTGNTVTVTFTATSARYLRATFTANTGWPAGQLSSLEAYTS